jgi:hypothetical protein
MGPERTVWGYCIEAKFWVWLVWLLLLAKVEHSTAEVRIIMISAITMIPKANFLLSFLVLAELAFGNT